MWHVLKSGQHGVKYKGPFLGLIYINNKGGEAPYFRGPALKFFIGSLFTTLTHWSHWVPWVRPLGEGKGGGRVGCKFSNQSKGKRHSKTMRHWMYKQSWNIHITYIMTWVICTSLIVFRPNALCWYFLFFDYSVILKYSIHCFVILFDQAHNLMNWKHCGIVFVYYGYWCNSS